MNTFTPTVKESKKYKLKQIAKRIIQTFYLPPKDKGKKFYYRFLSMPVKEKYVFYEAFAGLGILDNPRAIFKYLLSDPDFSDYTHVWSVQNISQAEENLREFRHFSNVIFVEKESKDYYRYLATCKYLISNSTFGYFFEKRKCQVYINTWHGVPTKYMGYEHAIESVENGRGPARNFLAADYLLSSNTFMTKMMYERAYRLKGLFDGKILECGSPRCDFIISSGRSLSDSRQTPYESISYKLSSLGINTDKKIILYAPTWKGNLYNQLDYNIDEFKNIIYRLEKSIDTAKYQIYLRVHYFLYKILSKDDALKDILIPFTIDTNELLSEVDILISDYSSIFFDFLCTGRPILFYVPDLSSYQSGRGLYVPVKELPGVVSSDLSQISNALHSICSHPETYQKKYESLYKKMQNWCISSEDGHACKRLTDTVWKGLPASGTTISFENHKKKTLICFNTRINKKKHYDELRSFIGQSDSDTQDITVVVTAFKDNDNKVFFNRLSEKARILVWYALPFYCAYSDDFFRREIRRTLGNTSFDEVLIIGETDKYWSEFAKKVKQF